MLDLNEIFLLFEDRINKNRNFLFKNPIKKLTASTKKEYETLYQEIEYYKKQNKYIAGYFPYDSNMRADIESAPTEKPFESICTGRFHIYPSL